MKKRLIKKRALMLYSRGNDPECKSYDRKMVRHKLYYFKAFWHFERHAKKRDWYWYYYYQGRVIDGFNHKDAIELANKCIADYDEIVRRKRNVRR